MILLSALVIAAVAGALAWVSGGTAGTALTAAGVGFAGATMFLNAIIE